MVAKRRREILGKQMMIIFKTTHFDRAGETGREVGKLGEIVAIDGSGWVVADTKEGLRIRCPLSRLYRAPAEAPPAGPRKRSPRPDYVAAEELIRDFHSATKPLTVRWLNRQSAHALYRMVAKA